MWTDVLQNAGRVTVAGLLGLMIWALATRKLVWGWQYDAQVRRAEHFMQLARKYAALARVSVEVAELLPEEQPEGGGDDGQSAAAAADGGGRPDRGPVVPRLLRPPTTPRGVGPQQESRGEDGDP